MKLEEMAVALPRHIMSVCRLFEAGRRYWMLIWIIAGVGGAILRGALFLLCCFLAAICSARIVGRVTPSIHHVGGHRAEGTAPRGTPLSRVARFKSWCEHE